ncbi:MAG: hypothetical protein WCT03_04480 [Candidatus Obscuribacterales bacterium]
MYRAALDQLLENVGFTGDSLFAKFAAFEEALQTNVAPNWSRKPKIDTLRHIKKLADSEMHGGELEAIPETSKESIQIIQNLFLYLVRSIYTEPARKAELKNKLQKSLEDTK